jgi:hypothetical protein
MNLQAGGRVVAWQRFDHVPLLDLPNHLAAQYVIRDWSESAAYQQYYRVDWALIPNLGLELFVLAARHVVTIDLAVRLFCILALALIFVGTRLANTELAGPRTRLYRIAPLFFYNGPLQYGFMSFTFGVGLALVAFGLYVRYWRGPSVAAVLAFIVVGASVLLCHLAAFGLFAIAVAGLEIGHSMAGFRRERIATIHRDVVRRGGGALLVLLPPFLLFFALGPETGGPHAIRMGNLREKIEAIAALTLFSSPGPELLLLALALLGFLIAFATRAVRFHPRAAPILLLMAVAFMAAPRVAMGGGFIDYRLPSASIFFALALLVPDPAARRAGLLVDTWFGALIAARVAIIAALWLAAEPLYQQFETAFARLPIGARLLVVEGQLGSTSAGRRPPLEHIAALAVARRQAFEPQMFAGFSGQVLKFQPAYQRLWTLDAPSTLDDIDSAYDHLLVVYPAAATISPALRSRLDSLYRTDGFELFSVAPIRR